MRHYNVNDIGAPRFIVSPSWAVNSTTKLSFFYTKINVKTFLIFIF